MNSLCSGNCEECRFRKAVPGTEERIDREPSYYCSIFDSKPARAAEIGYQEGFEAGYEAAVETITRLLMERKQPASGGAHKQPGKDPEKEGNL